MEPILCYAANSIMFKFMLREIYCLLYRRLYVSPKIYQKTLYFICKSIVAWVVERLLRKPNWFAVNILCLSKNSINLLYINFSIISWKTDNKLSSLAYITLHYITLHYITLHYIKIHDMIWYDMIWYDMIWYGRLYHINFTPFDIQNIYL